MSNIVGVDRLPNFIGRPVQIRIYKRKAVDQGELDLDTERTYYGVFEVGHVEVDKFGFRLRGGQYHTIDRHTDLVEILPAN